MRFNYVKMVNFNIKLDHLSNVMIGKLYNQFLVLINPKQKFFVQIF